MPATIEATAEPVYGVAVWDWISEELTSKTELRMLCMGCGESINSVREGVKWPGYIKFYRDPEACIVVKSKRIGDDIVHENSN